MAALAPLDEQLDPTMPLPRITEDANDASMVGGRNMGAMESTGGGGTTTVEEPPIMTHQLFPKGK
jgi:hypothetical protein